MNTLTKQLFPVFLALNVISVYAGETAKPVTEQIVDTLTKLAGGPHPGYRANHAKGIVVTGNFTPAQIAASISKAEHLQGKTVPVTVRFSDGTGVPTIPDADPNSFPKGMAIRFHLDNNASTDIVVISVNGFPAATPEDFLGLLNAIAASGPDVPKPTPVDQFLESHPAALKFVTTPKLPPTSFATQPFYGVNAFKFTNVKGETVHGRYRIEPVAGEKFLSNEDAAKATPDYLMTDLPARLKDGAVEFRILVQIAEAADVVTDPTVVWPDSRKTVELGTVSLTAVHPDGSAFEKNTMFNPLLLVDGIAPTDDPILHARPGAYAVSFSRRVSGQ